MDSVWEPVYLASLGRDIFLIGTTLNTENNKVHSAHSNAQCALYIKSSVVFFPSRPCTWEGLDSTLIFSREF